MTNARGKETNDITEADLLLLSKEIKKLPLLQTFQPAPEKELKVNSSTLLQHSWTSMTCLPTTNATKSLQKIATYKQKQEY